MTTPSLSIQNYLAEQSALDTLRFITCGSVDDGKSTLIGRMLFEAQCLFDDQITALQAESKNTAPTGLILILRFWWMGFLLNVNKASLLMWPTVSLPLTAASLLLQIPLAMPNTPAIWRQAHRRHL